MSILSNARSWRGFEGEEEMTEADWLKRGLEQALSMLHAGCADFSSLDDDGDPTFGCYNADYPDSWHEELTRRLDADEYYEAEVSRDIDTLFRAASLRRADEDFD